jgi:GNAT superfamily N-acetyltransferase
VSIRAAVVDDLPAMLALVRELARFEREPDAVAATEDGMRALFFDTDPAVQCSVAEEDGVIVGLAIWYLSYSTWRGTHGIYLEDLVVTAAARGRGHGRALLQHLARLCVQRGYARLEWTVLDWNDTAAGFYRSLGASPLPEWVRWRLTGPALAEVGSEAYR